jgi:hypothetical protein
MAIAPPPSSYVGYYKVAEAADPIGNTYAGGGGSAKPINNENVAKPTSAKHYGGGGGSVEMINNDNGADQINTDGPEPSLAKPINHGNGAKHLEICNDYGGDGDSVNRINNDNGMSKAICTSAWPMPKPINNDSGVAKVIDTLAGPKPKPKPINNDNGSKPLAKPASSNHYGGGDGSQPDQQ